MIRPIAAFLHVLDAARTAGTLARTVRLLARQLDNAHLLAASEEARADRAELRIAELEAAIADWERDSGAEPNLPDLRDAGEAPIPLVLTDSAREADIQRDRADSLFASLRACEVDLAKMREAKLAAEIRADVQRERAEQAERERDAAARTAGAHIATIEALREQIAAARRAAHAPARSLEERADIARRAWDESPPADPGPVEWDELPPAGQAAWCAVVRACDTSAVPAEQIPGVPAAPDDPPPTRPSERTATRTT